MAAVKGGGPPAGEKEKLFGGGGGGHAAIALCCRRRAAAHLRRVALVAAAAAAARRRDAPQAGSGEARGGEARRDSLPTGWRNPLLPTEQLPSTLLSATGTSGGAEAEPPVQLQVLRSPPRRAPARVVPTRDRRSPGSPALSSGPPPPPPPPRRMPLPPHARSRPPSSRPQRNQLPTSPPRMHRSSRTPPSQQPQQPQQPQQLPTAAGQPYSRTQPSGGPRRLSPSRQAQDPRNTAYPGPPRPPEPLRRGHVAAPLARLWLWPTPRSPLDPAARARRLRARAVALAARREAREAEARSASRDWKASLFEIRRGDRELERAALSGAHIQHTRPVSRIAEYSTVLHKRSDTRTARQTARRAPSDRENDIA